MMLMSIMLPKVSVLKEAKSGERSIVQFGTTFFTARPGDDFPGLPYSLSKTAKSRSCSRWFLSLSVR